ncbi:MAG: serine hydrolase domain-containing protein [Aggregatilineales bacterium]
MLRLLCVSALLLALFGHAPYAHADSTAQQLDAYFKTMLARYEMAGLGVAVIREDEVIFSKGYGVRDAETGAPVTPQTRFSIGSITKSMTALAAMRLAEMGKLSLDAPIVEYLPEFTLRNAEHAKTITLRQLLSHTSGLPRDDVAWYTGKIISAQDLLSHLAKLPTPNRPSTDFAYNNLGYALAGVVLERASGKPYAELLRELVLMPLGMESAALSYADMQKAPDFAQPHRLDVRQGAQKIAFFPHLDKIIAPAGAVTANVLDLADYARFHMGDGRFNGAQILPTERLSALHTPVQAGYGLGWVTTNLPNLQLRWHNGSIDGFAAMLAFVPDRQVGVVVLGNTNHSDNPNAVELIALGALYLIMDPTNAEQIDALTAPFRVFDPQARAERFAKARAFTPDVSAYAVYEGNYASFIAQITVRVRDGALYADVVQQGIALSAELVEFEPRSFIANAAGLVNSVFTFRLSENGSVALLQDGTTIGVRPPR